MLALHGAQTIGGAQFYIGCAQLKITGTGSEGSCTPTIELPGAYNANDSNIYIPNVYNGFDPTNYTAPGGPVAACGSSGAVSSTPSTTVAPAANSTIAVSSAVAPIVTASTEASVAPVETSVEGVPTSSVVVAETSAIVPVTTLSPVPTGNATVPTSMRVLPTTLATLVKPTAPAGNLTSGGVVAPTGSSSSGAAKLWYQCGGTGWTGATTCVIGASCVKQNDFYYQCIAQ